MRKPDSSPWHAFFVGSRLFTDHTGKPAGTAGKLGFPSGVQSVEAAVTREKFLMTGIHVFDL